MKADIVLEEDLTYALEVNEADGRFRVSIANGEGETEREMIADFDDLDGAVRLRIGDKSYFVEISESKGRYSACMDSHFLTGRLYTPDERLRERLKGSFGSGKNSVEAKMPGKVLEVFVQAGDTVLEGDKIAIVEAMKMENTIRAPKDGAIVEVGIVKGDNIQTGHTIVVIEEPK